jgi:hypothetical protein
MSLIKPIKGSLQFEDDSNFIQFEKILSQLQTNFAPPPPDERSVHSVPFVVTLTFEEQRSAVDKIRETLAKIYPKLGELELRAGPAVLAGGVAPGAGEARK